MNAGTALLKAARLFEDAGIAAPRLTAEVLLCHALHRQRPYLYAHPEYELSEAERLSFEGFVQRRLDRTPTQYITENQEFYGRPFRVTPDVLIPRPETEHVVETALELGRGARRVLDVGCGSGAIAVTMRLESGAAVFATDISPAAIAVAAGNARNLGAAVRFIGCDLMSAVAGKSMDLIVSNPPYVPLKEEPHLQAEIREFEPRQAVFAGETGLEIYERLAEDAPRVLRPSGWIVMELGFGCLEGVQRIFGHGWAEVRVVPDLAGIPRVLAAKRPTP